MTPQKAATARPPRIPPLENGDQLTREEFERRYEAMPHVKKAELLEGIVYMPSPVRCNQHANPQFNLVTWLGTYQTHTPGVLGADNGTVRLDLDNEPQPDGALIILPTHGGQARIDEDDYINGAPELVAEVSASTVSIDLTTKFRVYRRNRVREYVVWRVLDQTIDWFVLRQTQFDRLPIDSAVIYRSEVFPGLWLDTAVMTQFDMPGVWRVLQQGLASPEHAAFVAKLQLAAVKP